jgi:hypothetical protein
MSIPIYLLYRIERELEYNHLPILDQKVFSWNKIAGTDTELLLSHSQHISNLEIIDPYWQALSLVPNVLPLFSI